MYLQLAKHRFIETERLLLRPITLDDAPDMYEYASNEENVRLVFSRHNSIEETEFLIANLFMKNPLGHYAVELKEEKKMIGTADIRPDERSRSVEIAYALNQKYWGLGYATEIARKLVYISEAHLNAVRIWAMHDIENPASGHVLLKAGLEREGTMRNHLNLRGEYKDQMIYSRIKRE